MRLDGNALITGSGSGMASSRRSVHIPRGRHARAEEPAKATLLVASDDARKMTGASPITDGRITAANVTRKD